uniref:Uncharacterized protein n=1 Tax=Alexandrium monilatum TaxID=311494 RepID=A0A7S4SN44_9DINO|mmetsp:Transcript_67802/g.201741  ORF Transcript_67802/g.201741 Transcript_67802/m.201741 type:complete len:188 (-) Transcript_67802:470-1033(-)
MASPELAPELTPEAPPLGRPKDAAESLFLREGLAEVRTSAEVVYAENVDLRSRIRALAELTARLEQVSGLPKDVRANLRTVLRSALPPEAAFDPVAQPPGGPLRSVEPARSVVQGRVFALNARELCRSMDRYQLSQHHGRGSSGTFKAGPKKDRNGDDGEQLALTEYGESLWSCTRTICVELVTGWT